MWTAGRVLMCQLSTMTGFADSDQIKAAKCMPGLASPPEGGASRGAQACDDVQDAGRQASLVSDVPQLQAGNAGYLRRLQHHCVACCQGWSHLPLLPHITTSGFMLDEGALHDSATWYHGCCPWQLQEACSAVTAPCMQQAGVLYVQAMKVTSPFRGMSNRTHQLHETASALAQCICMSKQAVPQQSVEDSSRH